MTVPGIAISQDTCAHCFCRLTTGGQSVCCRCGYCPSVTVVMLGSTTWAPGVSYLWNQTTGDWRPHP